MPARSPDTRHNRAVPSRTHRNDLRVAYQGFARARERALEYTQRRDDVFIALTEACWWVCSLDEGLDVERPDYRHRRDADQNGRVVAGVRFARNVLGHERYFAAEAIGGLTIPFTVPLSIPPRSYLWMPSNDLPPRPDGSRKTAYDTHVARRPVVDTLMDCGQWLGQETQALT
jgi:hypothetical protein